MSDESMSERPHWEEPAPVWGLASFTPRAVIFGLGVLVVGFLVSFAWGLASTTSDSHGQDLLRGALLVLAAAIVALRAFMGPNDSAAWRVIAAGVVCWVAGDVLFVAMSWDGVAPEAPSIADLLYLAFYPLMYAGLILLAIRRVGRVRGSVWLDAVVVGMGLMAYFWFASEHILDNGQWETPLEQVVISLYPIADLILIGLLVGVLAMLAWPSDPMWLLFAAGAALFGLGDSAYLIAFNDGEPLAGSVLNSVWLASMVLIACAAWADTSTAAPKVRGLRAMTAPAVTAVAAFALLVIGDLVPIPLMSTLLAALTVVVATLRAVTVFFNVSIRGAMFRQANTDEATGLGNRRLLVDQMDHALETRAPDEKISLAVLEITSLSEVNEIHGRTIGDLLLQEVAGRLRREIPDTGTICHLQGDDFAVLFSNATTPEAALAMTIGVSAELCAPYRLADNDVLIAAHAGLAMAPDDAQTRQELMSAAAAARRHARRMGERYATHSEILD